MERPADGKALREAMGRHCTHPTLTVKALDGGRFQCHARYQLPMREIKAEHPGLDPNSMAARLAARYVPVADVMARAVKAVIAPGHFTITHPPMTDAHGKEIPRSPAQTDIEFLASEKQLQRLAMKMALEGVRETTEGRGR